MQPDDNIVRFRIVKLESLSGDYASIYSIILDNDKTTLFEHFILENQNSFKSELFDIFKRIRTIANKTGAREQYFKLNEGNPGDGVCALYDDPEKKLRLYCIRYGMTTIIIGSGGEKPKSMRTFQESGKLTKENYLLREISGIISSGMREGEIQLSRDGNDFIGNLEFNTDEEI